VRSTGRDQVVGAQYLQLAVAPYPHLAGQYMGEGGQGAFGLKVLPEAEQGIDQHHTPDRPAQLGCAGQKSHPPCSPEQQGHEVGQLIRQAQDQGPPPLRW
jgi:hypothetical protein